MKKNNIYLFVTTLLLLSGSLVSCTKFLDVQPKGTLPEDVQFSDEQGFKDALYGVYPGARLRTPYPRDDTITPPSSCRAKEAGAVATEAHQSG